MYPLGEVRLRRALRFDDGVDLDNPAPATMKPIIEKGRPPTVITKLAEPLMRTGPICIRGDQIARFWPVGSSICSLSYPVLRAWRFAPARSGRLGGVEQFVPRACTH